MLQLRINGTAPAWPVLLEHDHAFYRPENHSGLGSASYSLISCHNETKTSVDWEILIDAGHNTVPFLLDHGNRIPDAIMITHAHPDHILGVDWIVQSYRFKYRKSGKKMPVYCTLGVWNMLLHTYSYLGPYIELKELLPGQRRLVEETSNLSVTPYPVFHGQGAFGASMLYFESDSSDTKPTLITGDLLCPLVRKSDLERLRNAKTLFIDTNNRFPDPESNHISFARNVHSEGFINERLHTWFARMKTADLILPHSSNQGYSKSYFDEFLADWEQIKEIPHCILDFLNLIHIPFVFLMHYWGIYDEINYNERLLDRAELEIWANTLAEKDGLSDLKIHVPKAGDFFIL
jgi:hypothetical protein